MRVLIKGGVWKNSEDEILKSAIMKYGKNQWARVATLLPRKTAKQCKRRWEEWLDPMIKKTEWTREEDEKLLHLAKLMPTQWRTIAPMIGRTAGQCLERYGKLLDMASGLDSEESEESRKLRLGDIDPNPEDKPARPDPVDMDEDEKEMLSEAKARLANINGKKAKRKAREKLLENARRMAKLQKYRELKAAGVTSSKPLALLRSSKKSNSGIDYAREIPFERQVPMGFYDTSQEKAEGVARARAADAQKRLLRTANDDGNKSAKNREAAAKRDRERFEKLAKDNLEAAMKEIEERNAGLGGSSGPKRSRMSLPAPQVSEAEMDEIATLGRKRKAPRVSAKDKKDGLVTDYSTQTTAAAASALRTPLAPDVVMEEARNQRLRTSAQTPLVGGANAATSSGTGFDGYEPSVASAVTPSVFSASTRLSASVGGLGPGGVVRDHLNINKESEDDEPTEAVVSRREAKEKQRTALSRLRTGLGSLPQPKHRYELNVNAGASKKGKKSKGAQGDDDEEDEENTRPMDARDKKKLAQLEADARETARLERRSTVVKRGLPVPKEFTPEVCLKGVPAGPVREETVRLINTDIEGAYDQPKADAAAAEKLVEEQARKQFGADYTDSSNIGELLMAQHDALLIVPGQEQVVEQQSSKKKKKKRKAESQQVVVFGGPFAAVDRESATGTQKLKAARLEFMAVQNKLAQVTDALKKAEKKANLVTMGLQKRAAAARDKWAQAQVKLEVERRNAETFRFMRDTELSAIPERLAQWQERLDTAKKLEDDAQQRYFELSTQSIH